MTEKKKIVLFCLIAFLFISIFGAISHFFYEWSGKNKIAGFLFPANESTWEHLKLAIFPTLLFFFIGFFIFKNPNYLFAFFITLLTPMILIPAIFYSYTAITGSSILIVDILTYFISVFFACYFCYIILIHEPLGTAANIISIIGISIILICYFVFTLCPPKIFLFKDAVTGGYGLKIK